MSGASDNPTVSVIMAAYNGAALIGDTLASLSAQTFADFEIVVVDDCSTDDTLAVLRAWPDPRLRMIEAPVNGGPVRARNLAAAAARGRYFAGLDQDDLCHPDRFARQVAWLDINPAAVLVATATRDLQDGIVGPSRHVPHSTPALTEWLLRIENPLVWSSVMLRADTARQLDPFTRPDLLYAEDFDLYHRLARHGRIARIDQELLVYRRHAGGASNRYETIMYDSARRVLTEAYRAALGDDADDAARLVVSHLMAGDPVADRATLARLGNVLTMLQRAFLTDRVCDAADLRLIRWTTARRWAAVARASLRAGTVTLGDALSVRPPHLGLGHAGLEELLWARLIGRTRSATRRLSRQTFAA